MYRLKTVFWMRACAGGETERDRACPVSTGGCVMAMREEDARHWRLYGVLNSNSLMNGANATVAGWE